MPGKAELIDFAKYHAKRLKDKAHEIAAPVRHAVTNFAVNNIPLSRLVQGAMHGKDHRYDNRREEEEEHKREDARIARELQKKHTDWDLADDDRRKMVPQWMLRR